MQTFYETLSKGASIATDNKVSDYLVRMTESDLSRLNALQRLGGWGVWGNSMTQSSAK